LPCFFLSLAFLSCDLCIYFDEYLFQFYSGVFLISSLLLRAQSTGLHIKKKTNHHNSNNTIQAKGHGGQGSVVTFRAALEKLAFLHAQSHY
jgi:hypothetical protein